MFVSLICDRVSLLLVFCEAPYHRLKTVSYTHLVMTLFRLVEFIALHGMIVDAEASRVMAFVKGVWFDNVLSLIHI